MYCVHVSVMGHLPGITYATNSLYLIHILVHIHSNEGYYAV